MKEKACFMNRRLEIFYNKKYNKIFLSRCCYTQPFIGLDPKDINNIDIFFISKRR